jgi:hypothetical protein
VPLLSSDAVAALQSIRAAEILVGPLSLTARAKSVAELSLAWIVLRNPVEVAVTECGWGSYPGEMAKPNKPALPMPGLRPYSNRRYSSGMAGI